MLGVFRLAKATVLTYREVASYLHLLAVRGYNTLEVVIEGAKELFENGIATEENGGLSLAVAIL